MKMRKSPEERKSKTFFVNIRNKSEDKENFENVGDMFFLVTQEVVYLCVWLPRWTREVLTGIKKEEQKTDDQSEKTQRWSQKD